MNNSSEIEPSDIIEEQSSPGEEGSSSSPGLDAGASSSVAPPSTRQASFETTMKSIKTQFTNDPAVMGPVPEEEREPVSLYSERALEEAIDDVTRGIQVNLAYQRLGQACFFDPATRNALPSIEHVHTAYRDIMDNATLHDIIHSFVSEKMELERNLALEAVNQGEIGLQSSPDYADASIMAFMGSNVRYASQVPKLHYMPFEFLNIEADMALTVHRGHFWTH